MTEQPCTFNLYGMSQSTMAKESVISLDGPPDQPLRILTDGHAAPNRIDQWTFLMGRETKLLRLDQVSQEIASAFILTIKRLRALLDQSPVPGFQKIMIDTTVENAQIIYEELLETFPSVVPSSYI